MTISFIEQWTAGNGGAGGSFAKKRQPNGDNQSKASGAVVGDRSS